jgi:TRAP-type C4-dicarboxylate transport system permease small subunit
MAVAEPLDTVELAAQADVFVLRRPWTRAIDRAIGAVVEPLAALLVCVEICILAAGVFTRYVLGNPLVWSDELGTILFLWLAMLGSVVAYRRGEHIRLSVILRRASPRVREILEAISSVVTAIFVIELMPGALAFFKQEEIDVTPALGIPQSYVVLAIIVALALILVLALIRLAEMNLRVVATVTLIAVVVSAAAWFGRAAFVPLGNLNLILFFVVFVGGCVAIGIPIAFSFAVGTLS